MGATTCDAVKCSACGHVFPEDEPRQPCACGSTARTFEASFEAKVEPHVSLGLRQKRSGFPGFLVNLIERVKIARKTGYLAREVQLYDRSDPDKTVKYHRVEERQPDGSWNTEHEHREENPAKRRPPPKLESRDVR
jgi:hypothetical protein